MRTLIAISNLDTIKKKNLLDINHLSKSYNLRFEVFSYDQDIFSHTLIKCHTYKKNLFLRLLQYTNFVWTRRKQLNHVEIYTGCGNFWIIECLVSKILGIKVIVCERGSPLRNIHKNSRIIYFAKISALKFLATRIWIRELWMIDKLISLNIQSSKVCLIPNAISVNNKVLEQRNVKETATFLWVNSFKEFRRLDWVYNIFNELSITKSDLKLTILGDLSGKGIVPSTTNQTYADRLKTCSFASVLSFCDPYDFYLSHTFFILPADIVYLNNSLLESMACGCIPIVSDVQGARLIIPNEDHGIAFSNNEQSFKQAVLKALSLTDAQLKYMQQNVITHLQNKFSVQSKAKKLVKMYRNLK